MRTRNSAARTTASAIHTTIPTSTPSPPPVPSTPPPEPPPPPLPPQVCNDQCSQSGWAKDGVCDDGGPGAEYDGCETGTDCTDCGIRFAPSPPPLPPPLPPPPSPLMPPSRPPPVPPKTPPPPSFPPPPPAVETAHAPIELRGVHAAACAIPGGCTFAYALAETPVLVSTSPATGNEGDTLTVVGHAFSAVASENFVMVGGKPCIVTSASNDGSFSPASCPVTSCTLEMQTRMILKCRLPHNDAFQPHVVATGVIGRGRSPLLSTAGVVQYARQLRAFEPSRGSLAGGTTVTLYGDGLSERLGDISVNIGGIRCSVFAANDSHVSCVTGATTSTTSTSSTISMSIRGVTATCVPGSCQYTYDDSLTPKLSSATVVTRTTTKWTIRVQGSGFVTPSSANIILLGGITPCIPYGHEGDTSSQVTCQCDPPLAGDQIVTLANEMGLAKGVPALPLIRGVELSVGSFTPST